MINLRGSPDFTGWCRENGIPALSVMVSLTYNDNGAPNRHMMANLASSRFRTINHKRPIYFFIRCSDFPLVALRYGGAVREVNWLSIEKTLGGFIILNGHPLSPRQTSRETLKRCHYLETLDG